MKHRQISRKPSKKFLGYILLSIAIYASAIVAYRLVWTNYVAEKETEAKTISIREDWNTPGAESSLDLNKGFALLYIPRLRDSVWELPISQGVDSAQLDTGSGHYPLSAKPGENGNFALAGHRSGHGEPFANFELIQTGDRVIVETEEKWLVYELAFDAEVKPEELWVIDSNPGGLANKVGTDKLLTLVTCTPRYGSTGRWVWWGYLVEELPKKQIPSDVKAS